LKQKLIGDDLETEKHEISLKINQQIWRWEN